MFPDRQDEEVGNDQSQANTIPVRQPNSFNENEFEN